MKVFKKYEDIKMFVEEYSKTLSTKNSFLLNNWLSSKLNEGILSPEKLTIHLINYINLIKSK